MANGVTYLFVVVICHILQSDEKEVADKLAYLVLMDTLGGDDFRDLKDLRICDLFDLFS